MLSMADNHEFVPENQLAKLSTRVFRVLCHQTNIFQVFKPSAAHNSPSSRPPPGVEINTVFHVVFKT